MWQANGSEFHKDFRLQGIEYSKVSNLKMADYDKEIPFGDGVDNRGVDDADAIEMQNFDPYDSFSRRGSVDITAPHSSYKETSFTTGGGERIPLLSEEFRVNRQEAAKILKGKFPNWNPLDSTFNATLNSRGEVEVMLTDTTKAVPHVIIDADENVNEREIKKSKKIKNSLGPPAEDIVETNREEISRREKKLQELQASRETASRETSENIDAGIEEQRNEISRLETENDIIEERMSLRDRVKSIFKKYGVTVFAVVSAVGLVIGVIVNNLKKGLTSLEKRVGGALKNIGKKIGEILPGMIGAVASFVFKTAGEAVGFLAKNAWLLILAAVMFMIEKFKKK